MAAAARETAESLRGALREARSALRMGVVLTVMITATFLALPFYLMNIFTRVIPTQNAETLAYLTGITIALFLAMGGFEMLRSRLLVRVGRQLDHRLSGPVFDAMQGWSARRGLGTGPLSNLEAVRSFAASPSVAAFFDTPMGLLFLLVLFYLHVLLGLIATVGLLALVGLGWLQEVASRPSYQEGQRTAESEAAFVDATIRGRETAVAMGMLPALQARWTELRDESVGHTLYADEVMRRIKGWTPAVQNLVRVGVLATACWLAIAGVISPALLFVANILAMRAMMPAMQAVTAWKGFLGARDAYQRLNRLLRQEEALIGDRDATALPAPAGHLRAKELAVDAPTGAPILRRVSFDIQPGEMVGVTGANGSGKSTIARAMVGAVRPRAGYLRLDGVDVAAWQPEDRGRHVGYLPQDIELFDGTIAENISRFQETGASDAVVAAARQAGADAVIRDLPAHYDTLLAEGEGPITPGQRQRIALARALYGTPALVVLDEANSSLDSDSQEALMGALEDLKAGGCTIVMITHNAGLLRRTDKVMIVKGGTVAKIAATSKVLPNPQPAADHATDAPATDAPATDAPATDAPAAHAQAGDAQAGDATQAHDPADTPETAGRDAVNR